MLNLIGNYSLIFSLILSFLIIFICLKNLRLTENLNFNIFVSTSLQFLLISICFLALLFAFVYSDFSNLAVYYNSHTTKPLFYKISGTWGNHEGSLLLWLLVLSLFNLIFFLNSKKMLNSFRNLAIFFNK